MTANLDIRCRAQYLNVPLHKIAREMGISDNTLFRKLRNELDLYDKQIYFDAIEKIANEQKAENAEKVNNLTELFHEASEIAFGDIKETTKEKRAEGTKENGNLDATARAMRNAYYREWRKKNPEKTKEYTKRYWERKLLRDKAEKMKSYVYIMRMRPPGPGCQPKEGLIGTTDVEMPFHGRQSWGTARYSRLLTEEEEKHYDMEYLGIVEDW